VKKSVTLFLLVLFVLNVVGYYAVLVGLRMQTAERFRETIDHETIGAELTFKIPLAIPYSVDATEYSPVQGEFEYEGEVFQLVKQKHLHDTLYIVCVKDRESKKINQALTDYVKTFTDKPSHQKHNSKTIQILGKDFFSTRIELTSHHVGYAINMATSIDQKNLYSLLLSTSVSQPPEVLV
jgi:hypothetical protein